MTTPGTGEISGTPGLPLQLTRFVGRARELEDLSRLLPVTRLLTLTGAGGSGKTRLAYEAAARSNGAFERIAWVDLAPVQDHLLIPSQILLGLKAPERSGVPAMEQIVTALGSRRILLVLDNCEHVVDACAGIVESLLRECAGLSVVATSREALGVMGETAWLVPPLTSGEAVQLFMDRARSVVPGFALTPQNSPAITEICRRLDGLPLAIELAAARVRVLSPEQIAERLSDAFKLLSASSRSVLPRHRTLRGAMDWSYTLLSEREQILLRRLSVFAGTFSLGAAEAVCVGAGISDEEVLDSITTLVDKSLVVLSATDGEARYHLLETVKQYGDELLQSKGERDELRSQHADYYLAMAEHAAPRLFGGANDRRLVAALTDETDNLRAAGNWAMEDPARLEKALRLGSALHWFWFAKGRFEEGRKRLSAALAQDMHSVAPGVRAWALIALGHIYVWQGNPARGLPLMQEALILEQDLADPEGLAYALNGIGACTYLSGDAVRCEHYFLEAIPIAQGIANQTLHAIILYYHGRAALDRNDNALARRAFETATRIGRTTSATPVIAHPLVMEGRLAYREGRLVDAMASYHESLTLHAENHDAWGAVLCLEGISYVAAAKGQFLPATRLMAHAELMRQQMSAPLWPTEVEGHNAVKRLLMEKIAGFSTAWTEGESLEFDRALALALELSAAGAPETERVIATATAPAARSVPDLEVRALGPLQVLRQGDPIEPGAWGSARPRELLIFLLMHPEGCTKEQVGLAFWPEASAAQVRNSFHVTLHRLRKALGHPEWVVTQNERYRLDPSLRIQFDVDLFEKEMGRGLKSGSASEALATGLTRYQGDFLEGEAAGDWHLEYRERLQRLYADGLNLQAARWLEAGHVAEAADACRRILARDEMHEEAWRRLMLCHARSGERAQALRVYQQLADLLKREFDAEPDAATRAVLKEIRDLKDPR